MEVQADYGCATTRLAFRKEETSWFSFGHATTRSLPIMPLPSYAPAHPLPLPTSRPMKSDVGVSGSAMPNYIQRLDLWCHVSLECNAGLRVGVC
jgi:hypothetical protein